MVGAVEMSQASDAVDTARGEVDSCESKVSSYRKKVSKYQSKIRDTRRNMESADQKLQQREAELRALSGRREALADFQAKMRSVLHHLGVLSGVGSAAELHTRRQVLLEPVMKVMAEMTAALGRITGDELLNTKGIKSLMGRMKRNQHQLRQLADGQLRSATEECFYLGFIFVFLIFLGYMFS